MYGGYIVEPTSPFEENVIKKLVHSASSGSAIWLGFTDMIKFGHFVKGSDGSELEYTNWDNRSPLDDITKRGMQHCTIMPMVSI